MKSYLTRRGFIRHTAAASAALTWLGTRLAPNVFAAETAQPALLGGAPAHKFDLAEAAKAEIVIEKLQCHTGTRGLSISVNGHEWVAIPEAPGIPAPQWDYQHHIYPVVPVPLSQLQASGNQFRMRVNDPPPAWPQNLIYGVHFRIYYDAAKKPHPAGRLVSPKPNSGLGKTAELQVEASSPHGSIRQVDFLGNHEDVNWEGDNVYSQWHYHYVSSRLTNHIGSVTAPPFRQTWDTSWIPDQAKPFELAARITDETGLIHFTQPVSGLTFNRPGLSVELCKPYDVPELWVTRRGKKSEKIRVAGDLSKAVAAQLVWCSWSPGYMSGLFINDRKDFDAEGPHYAYYAHRVPLKDLGALKPGENVIKTGQTPKRNGQMVHGMEVNWPGIMVLIQYQK